MRIKYAVGLSLLAGVTIGAAAVQGLHAQSKPPVYIVSEIMIDEGKLDTYMTVACFAASAPSDDSDCLRDRR
jgi:hypothetical protein